MNKKDKIDLILNLVKNHTDEFLEFEEQSGFDMLPEDIVIAAVESVLGTEVTTIQYGSPLGIVDRDNVSFMVDDELDLPIWGKNDED